MQAGQNPTDPLTLLNGPQGHGIMAGLNPFAGTGLNINDPNMVDIFLASIWTLDADCSTTPEFGISFTDARNDGIATIP